MSLDLDKSTWRRVKFGDVIDSITDRVDDPSSAGVDRYVGLEHLDPGVLTVERWDSPDKVEAQKLRFQPGDVIFGRRRAYQKKVARADFEGICSAHALVLRAKSGLMHPDFLPVFLASDYFLDRAIGISVGSLSPTVNWRDLKVQEFDLPPVPEQERLALLWAVEDHRRALIGLELAGKNSMNVALATWFTSLPGELVKLRDVLDIVRGGSPRPINDYFTEADDGLHWIKIGDVPPDGKYIDATAQKISPAGLKKTRTVKPGDFLLSNSMSFGRPYIVRIDGCIHDGWLALSDTRDVWRTEYLYHLLRSAPVQRQFLQGAGGSTVKNLNTEIVGNVFVVRPKVSDQDSALSRIEVMEAAIGSMDLEKRSVSVLRSSLLNEIFGGN